MNAAMFREAQRFDRGDRLSVLRTFWVAFRYRPARMEIRLDDRIVRTRALMVTVANGPYTGVGLTVAPEALLDDGQFDVIVFRRFSKVRLLRHLASIAFGRRRVDPELQVHRSRTVRITSAHPLPARADAHHLGSTPVEFTVRPHALRVIVPAGAEEAAVRSGHPA
jgi:diacylglycerol kinase family enzyme